MTNLTDNCPIVFAAIRKGDRVFVDCKPAGIHGIFEVEAITRFGPAIGLSHVLPLWAEISPPF